MRTAELPRFDLTAPEVLADPYPEYARLRAAGPLARGLGGQWVLSRHAEVSAVLRDRRHTKQVPLAYYESLAGAGPAAKFLGRMQDLLEDRRVTGLLVRSFKLEFLPRLAQYAADAAERLLEEAMAGGTADTVDAVTDIGVRLPVTVVCELFGIPEVDREHLRRSIAALVLAFSDSVLVSSAAEAAARRTAADVAVQWQQGYLRGLIAQRGSGGDDALSVLLAARPDGVPLSDQVVVDSVVMSCYAGFETAMAMISGGLLALSARPDQWARLRADPALVRTAVEEFARYDAPIQIGLRRVVEPIEIAGRRIRAGRLLILLLGSANRDERRFADPDGLDVGRQPNPHVSYGGGAYYCLGAALARLEGAVVLTAMIRRFARIEPAGPAVRQERFNFPAYASVPLAVTRA